MSHDHPRRDHLNDSTSSSRKSSATRHGAVASPPPQHRPQPMHFGRSNGFPPLQSLPPVRRHENAPTSSSHSPRSASSSRASSATRSRAPARTSPSVSTRTAVARSARSSPMPRAVLHDVSASSANTMRHASASKRQRDNDDPSERSRAPPRCSPSIAASTSQQRERHRPWASRPTSRALTPLTAPAQSSMTTDETGGSGFSPKANRLSEAMPAASEAAALPPRVQRRASVGSSDGRCRPSDVTVSPMSERGDARGSHPDPFPCIVDTDDGMNGDGTDDHDRGRDTTIVEDAEDDAGARSTVLSLTRTTGSPGTPVQLTSPSGKPRRSITAAMTSVVSKAKLEEVFTDLEARYQLLRDRGAARDMQSRVTEELAASALLSPAHECPTKTVHIRAAAVQLPLHSEGTDRVDEAVREDPLAGSTDLPMAPHPLPCGDEAASTSPSPAPMDPPQHRSHQEEISPKAAHADTMQPHQENCTYQPFQCDSAVFHYNRSPLGDASTEERPHLAQLSSALPDAAESCEHIQPTHLSFASAWMSEVSALTCSVGGDAPSSILDTEQSMRSELNGPALLAQADALFDKFQQLHHPLQQQQPTPNKRRRVGDSVAADAVAISSAVEPAPATLRPPSVVRDAACDSAMLKRAASASFCTTAQASTTVPFQASDPVSSVTIADAARALGIDADIAATMMRRFGRVLVRADPWDERPVVVAAREVPHGSQVPQLLPRKSHAPESTTSPSATKAHATSSAAKRDANGSPLLIDPDVPDSGLTANLFANTSRALHCSPPPLDEPHASHLPLSKGWLRR